MNKIDLIVSYLNDDRLPMLDKSREWTIQEYMKLKHSSIRKIAENYKTK